MDQWTTGCIFTTDTGSHARAGRKTMKHRDCETVSKSIPCIYTMYTISYTMHSVGISIPCIPWNMYTSYTIYHECRNLSLGSLQIWQVILQMENHFASVFLMDAVLTRRSWANPQGTSGNWIAWISFGATGKWC